MRRSCSRARSTTACRSPPPIRSTSSTRRAPPGGPKGVVRDNGGHMVALKWSMKNLYGVEPGEVYWAASDVGWVVGHSYIVYAPLLHGCTSILYEGKPVGTPDAGAFWRVIAEHGCVSHVHRADRVPRHQEGGPAGQAAGELRPFEVPCAVPRRRARRSRHRGVGGEAAEGAGDRSLVADRDRLVHRRQSAGPRPAAGEARLGRRCRCRAITIDIVDERSPAAAGEQDRLDRDQAAAAAGVPADAVAAGRALQGKLPRASFPATTRPPTPASRTRTATSTSWAAPTTSSMSPGTGSRPAAWRRCWPRTRTWPNARSSASPTSSRARCRAASSCSRPASTGRRRDRAGDASRWCATRSARSRPSSSRSRSARLPKTRSGKILRGTMKKIADGEPWTMPATIDDPAILDEIGGGVEGQGGRRDSCR